MTISGVAWPQALHIDLSGANYKPYPLAIEPFQPIGGAPQAEIKTLQDTLGSDLQITGLFQVLDPRSFLASPAQEGLAASTIDFSKWTSVGAQGLLKATVAEYGSALTVDLHLFDTASATEQLHKSYQGTRVSARALAHHIADDLVLHFTGQPGIFETRIAYVRVAGRRRNVWVSNWDGTEARAVTHDRLALLPAWSPDGRTLAFTSYRSGTPYLYAADLITFAIRPLVRRGDLVSGACYSPGGKRMALTISSGGSSAIYLAGADGSNLRVLAASGGIDTSPTWSPDGKQIAFVSDRDGTPQIFVMDATGANVHRLTWQGNYNQEPKWSPRGNAIVFTARDERKVFDLFSVDPQSGKITRLTQDQGRSNWEPSWAPNGRHILFVSDRTGHNQLWLMSPDGSNQIQISHDRYDYSSPAWGPLPKN